MFDWAHLRGRYDKAHTLLRVSLLLNDGGSTAQQGFNGRGDGCLCLFLPTDAHHALVACCSCIMDQSMCEVRQRPYSALKGVAGTRWLRLLGELALSTATACITGHTGLCSNDMLCTCDISGTSFIPIPGLLLRLKSEKFTCVFLGCA